MTSSISHKLVWQRQRSWQCTHLDLTWGHGWVQYLGLRVKPPGRDGVCNILGVDSESLARKPFKNEDNLCGEGAWLPGKVSEPTGETEVPLGDGVALLGNGDEPLGGAVWPPGEAVVPGGEGF